MNYSMFVQNWDKLIASYVWILNLKCWTNFLNFHVVTHIMNNKVIGSRAGQYLNTLYLNTVFKYIYCIYTLYSNTFFNLYLITVFKYFSSVFKYMYLDTFLNTFLHTPLNINNRSSVDWSANHGFKHFNAGTCCICLLLNNTVLYPLLCYISQLKKFI